MKTWWISVMAVLVLGVVSAMADPAALLWDPPTLYEDGTSIQGTLTYNVYQNGSKVAAGLATNRYDIAVWPPAVKTVFTVTAIENGVESGQSTPLTINKPKPPSKPWWQWLADLVG